MNTQFQWANNPNPLSLPSKFILPYHQRPSSPISSSSSDQLPVIDLINTPREQLISDIYSACHSYGFFQIINHGVPVELCKGSLDAVTEFFELGHSKKAGLVTETHMEDGKIFKYYLKRRRLCDRDEEEDDDNGKIEMWGEALFHTWSSVDYSAANLPLNPPRFRETIVAYTKEISKLMTRLLSLMSLGLGLDEAYLEKCLGRSPEYTAQANYYPPCPEPEMTLGLGAHTDIGAITVLLQEEGVTGLHVNRDGKWVAVDPIPNAFVINLGDQMEVLTNGKYKSVRHRAVTNRDKRRVSYAVFCGPREDAVIGPVDAVMDEHNPRVYNSYRFGDYMKEYRKQQGQRRMVKELYRLP